MDVLSDRWTILFQRFNAGPNGITLELSAYIQSVQKQVEHYNGLALFLFGMVKQ